MLRSDGFRNKDRLDETQDVFRGVLRPRPIRIQPTRYFHPKSEDSIADLPVDAEVMALFRQYHEAAKGVFVIKSKRFAFAMETAAVLRVLGTAAGRRVAPRFKTGSAQKNGFLHTLRAGTGWSDRLKSPKNRRLPRSVDAILCTKNRSLFCY